MQDKLRQKLTADLAVGPSNAYQLAARLNVDVRDVRKELAELCAQEVAVGTIVSKNLTLTQYKLRQPAARIRRLFDAR